MTGRPVAPQPTRDSFTDRSVIVTGGAGGIGRALARAFALEGAQVAVVDVDVTRAAHVAGDLAAEGLRATAYEVDVRDADAVEARWTEIADRHGGLDIVVNNAGTATRGTIETITPAEWAEVLAVNLSGAFHGTRAAVPHLRERGGGSILNVASIAGRWIAYFAGPHYATSKAGLLSLTRQSAFELGRYGIRVNAICPGPMQNRMGSADEPNHAREIADLPLGRNVHPSEIADAATFLCSDRARMITGVDLPVDAGFLTATSASYPAYFATKGIEFERTASPPAPPP